MIRIIAALLGALLFSACAKTSETPPPPAPAVSASALTALHLSGNRSVLQTANAAVARITALDESYAAVIALNPNWEADAKSLDSLVAAGQARGSLFGIPVLLKDNIEANIGVPTTAGAGPLAKSDPQRDAFITQQLRAAGALILGKTNLSEWANFHSTFSSSGLSTVGGQTRNAHDTTRSPCGSSSGSGVAVALDYTPLAIGTETNGSIVCPAHANGIVGLKPTVGLLSRAGIVPISESQDTPGPMAKSVADVALALTVLQGEDPNDSYTAAGMAYQTRDYSQAVATQEALQGKRLGLFTAPLGNHFRVDSLMYQTVRKLEAAGAEVIEIAEIAPEPLGGSSFSVLLYEFKDGLNTYLSGLPEGAGHEADSVAAIIAWLESKPRVYDYELFRMAQAKGPLTEDAYKKARAKASRLMGPEGIDRVIQEHKLDAILAPTGAPAWKIDAINGDHFILGSSSPAAISGYPNLTVPMGKVDHLPVGLSIFAGAWSEPTLIEIGSAWEDLRGPF